jgi:hypothetical protein
LVSLKCRALASQEGVCSMEEDEKEEEILEGLKEFVHGINRIKKLFFYLNTET